MKRRTFISGLSALFAAPALPKVALATAAPVSAAAQDHYWVAKLIAETRGAISPAQLGAQLRIPAGLAADVQTLLVERGIVSAPIKGVAHALSPIRLPALNTASATHAVKARNVKLKLDKLADYLDDDEVTEEAETTLSDQDQDSATD